jgi:hypothetical protein
MEKSPVSPTMLSTPYSHITSLPPKPLPVANAAEVPAITPRQVGRSLPRPRVSEEDEWDSHGVTLARPKDKSTTSSTNDVINVNEIQDIPTWFRSLRLHKYTTIFENDDWRAIIRMNEEQLIEKGVAALGARRKMLKVFEAARNELTARKIPF